MSYLVLLLMVFGVSHHSPAPVNDQSEWHFIASQNNVKFYWREEPTWHQIEIMAQNSGKTAVNYSYEFSIMQGSRVAYEGNHQWFNLKKNSRQVIRVAKEFPGVSRVAIREVRVQLHR